MKASGPIPATSSGGSFSVGVALGLTLIAFVVSLKAGHDQSLGPIDLVTAQRLGVFLWLVAPIAGGLALRRPASGSLPKAAIAAGLVVGLVVALFPASGTGEYTCSISLPTGPFAYVLGRLAVGALVGGGMAIAFAVTGLARRRGLAIVPGVVLAAATTYAASSAAFALFYDGVRCL